MVALTDSFESPESETPLAGASPPVEPTDSPARRVEGWYPDPWGLEKQRWYDGATWTRHLWPPEDPPAASQPQAGASGAVPAVQTPSGQLIPVGIVQSAAERSAKTLNTLIPLASIGLALVTLSFAVNAPELRANVDLAAAGSEIELPPLPPALQWFAQLGQIGVIATAVVFALWLYRATIWSRLLGMPGRLAPGWALAVWLLPIVNLLLGYLVTVDAAPTPTLKRTVRMWWAWFVFACTAPVVIIVTGNASAAFRYPLAGGLMASSLIAGFLGRKIVRGITTELSALTQPKNSPPFTSNI